MSLKPPTPQHNPVIHSKNIQPTTPSVASTSTAIHLRQLGAASPKPLQNQASQQLHEHQTQSTQKPSSPVKKSQRKRKLKSATQG